MKNTRTKGLVLKIVSGGQTGVDRGALEAALELGFPYGGYIPKGRRAEDGVVPTKFTEMTEDTRKDYLHRTELNVINSDATLILSRTTEQTGGTKRTIEFCEKHGKPYWIENLEQLNETDRGLEFLYWIEAEFGERGIVLNIAGPRESKEAGIQAETRSFLNCVLSEPSISNASNIQQVIIESPFVKEDDDEGFLWSFRVVEPTTNQQIDTSISPYALLNSLGEERGEQELLTCGCGVAECARISHEKFECTEKYVHWSFVEMGAAHSLFFDRISYEMAAIEMLHDIYVTKVGWRFNAIEYNSYEDFKTAVDEFLAAKPHFKAMWDEAEEDSM